jgi:hypothetical protein
MADERHAVEVSVRRNRDGSQRETAVIGYTGEAVDAAVHGTRALLRQGQGSDAALSVSPGPHLECFARHTRQGWEAWGNEVGRLDADSSDVALDLFLPDDDVRR